MKKAVCMLVAAAMVVTSLQVTGTADAAKKKATLKTKKNHSEGWKESHD